MKNQKNIKVYSLLFFLAFATTIFAQGRQTLNFDANWQFTKGEMAGAEKPEFNDKSWRNLDVPHDGVSKVLTTEKIQQPVAEVICQLELAGTAKLLKLTLLIRINYSLSNLMAL